MTEFEVYDEIEEIRNKSKEECKCSELKESLDKITQSEKKLNDSLKEFKLKIEKLSKIDRTQKETIAVYEKLLGKKRKNFSDEKELIMKAVNHVIEKNYDDGSIDSSFFDRELSK
jgi:hypothetical protein